MALADRPVPPLQLEKTYNLGKIRYARFFPKDLILQCEAYSQIGIRVCNARPHKIALLVGESVLLWDARESNRFQSIPESNIGRVLCPTYDGPVFLLLQFDIDVPPAWIFWDNSFHKVAATFGFFHHHASKRLPLSIV